MKKVKYIYNPFSGDASSKNKIDIVIERFQNMGYTFVPYRSSKQEKLEEAFSDIDDGYELIAISGGDGTISSVINIMTEKKIGLPIAIFPNGTSNDFATFLGISKDTNECCDIIEMGKTKKIDIGKANDRYFINVCSAGLLTDIPHKTETVLKNALGQVAYYLKSLEEIPKYIPLKMRIEYGDNKIEDTLLMLLILNSRSAGGFNKLAPLAMVDDGKFDVVAIKSGNIPNLLGLFLKILVGDHVTDPQIYYFQTDKMTVNCDSECETDIDGEKGPMFPLTVEVMKQHVEIYVPK